MKNHLLIIIIVAISAILIFYNLGGGSLSSWDEAFYAQVSREMFESGDMINLTWANEPWNDKPPLYMWVTAFFYKVFGINEFSARLFSAVSALILVILTYLIALKLFTERTATLASIMLPCTYHFLWFSKMGTLDVTLTMFLFLSLYLFIMSEEKPILITLSFVSFAMAFLTKGAGAILIVISLLLYLAITRKWFMVLNKYSLYGFLLFLALTGAWYVSSYLNAGPALINGHFFQHVIKRLTIEMDQHGGNILTYINAILYKGKPWGSVGLIAAPFFLLYSFKERNKNNFFLICWIITVILVFTAVKTKLHWYIIPVYPAIVIVAAWGVERVFRKYAVIFVVTLSVITLTYSSRETNLFAMDFNNNVKSFSGDVINFVGDRDRLFLFRIEDPGLRFYLGERAKHIREFNDLIVLYGQGNYVVTRIDNTEDVKGDRIMTDKSGKYVLVKL